ncbi:MAG: hypothetical protein ACYCWB_15855, partial [Thiobacillus sp.]
LSQPSSSNLPMRWVPFTMHAGDNDDFLVNDAIEERIRKPVKKCAPSFTVDDWEPVWMLGNCTKNESYSSSKYSSPKPKR